VTRSRELCAQALGYSLPSATSFGLLAQLEKAPAAITGAAYKAGLRGMVLLVHGTSRADKEWPLEQWRELARRCNEAGYGVALAHGNALEEMLSRQIAEDLEYAQVWPRMPLDALLDAMASCAGMIGVDSGLSHMAVALDLPHVQIYNVDTAWRTGPLAAQAAGAQTRQCSVFAQPAPSVAAVWQAWQAVTDISFNSFFGLQRQ
jgi:heptosyltransferase-1